MKKNHQTQGDENQVPGEKHSVKILAPVDFSTASEVSGAYAVEVAKVFDAEIVFLHVVPENSLSGKLFFPQSQSDKQEEGLTHSEKTKALEKLETFLAALPLKGVRYSKRVEKGVPFVKILQAVETLKPEVVIQGTHGTTGLEGRVVGGTAERIIRKTNCPVISVKPRGFGSFLSKIVEGIGLFEVDKGGPTRPRESYTFPPKRILHPTDFSEASHRAVKPAVDLAHLADAELIVLHVTDQRPDGPNPEKDRDRFREEPVSAREQMENLLKEMNAYYEDLRITPRILKSGSTSVILSFAVQEEIDLMVMGTHGRKGWNLILTGSTADRSIRNAPCPVLTVRPNWKLEEVENKFRKIFRKLTPMDLQKISSESGFIISEDLMDSSGSMKTPEMFLNYYSREGMHKVLEEYGILEHLRNKGMDGFKVVFDLKDPFRHRVKVFCEEKEDPEHLLIDMIAREGILKPVHQKEDAKEVSGKHFSVLVIEWLCMQNPRAEFTPDRPPLPGQDFPGLRIGYEAHEFLVVMGMRLRKDGIMNHPQYYHNARLYHEKFKFYDPVKEGRLIALIRDTGDSNLADVSWAVYHGCLLEEVSGEVMQWEGGTQVYPLSGELGGHFLTQSYHEAVWETVANSHYRIDWELFRSRMQSGLKAK